MYLCFFAIALPFGIFFSFAAFSLIMIFREKRYVWELEPQGASSASTTQPANDSSQPYQPPAVADSELPLSAFAAAMCGELDRLQYRYLGNFRHVKRGIYKIRYDVWLSADTYVLAFVEAGSLAAIPVSNITLCTLGDRGEGAALAEPSYVALSIINESAFEPSLSGDTETMLFPQASLEELNYLHYQRFGLFRPRPFSGNPLEAYYHFRRREVDANESQGLCRFADDSRIAWLPSLGGGIKMFLQMYRFMLSRRVYSDRRRLKRRLK